MTGGAGFIGSNLVEALVNEHEVTVLDNFHTGSMQNLETVKDRIEIIEGSSNDLLSLNVSPEVIFHLGIPSSSPMYKEDPFLTGEAINGMVAVMEKAKRCESRKVVFASSSSLYSGLPTPHREDAEISVTDYYTEARLAIERIAQLYNRLYEIDFAGLRFFSVYGPHEEAKGRFANMVTQFLWEMKKGNAPLIYGDGIQSRDFVFVEDVVDALILTTRRGTGIFNVGTGVAHSFKDVVDILNYKLNLQIEPVYVDNIIKNYVMHTQADTIKAKMLGFNAQVSLQEGIGKIVNTRRNYD